MADGFNMSMTGNAELDRRLRLLPDKLQSRVVKKGIRAAGKPILKTAKARVPVETGALKKSLGTKLKTYRHSGNSVLIIGPRTDDRYTKGERKPHKYAHLVERGTKHIPAVPFMRFAFMSQQDTAKREFQKKLEVDVEKELGKQF